MLLLYNKQFYPQLDVQDNIGVLIQNQLGITDLNNPVGYKLILRSALKLHVY